VWLDLAGVLTSLSPEQAKTVKVGLKLPESGPSVTEVLAVGVPGPEVMHIKTGDKATLRLPGDGALDVPVRLRTMCYVNMGTDGALRCMIRNVAIAPDTMLQFDGLGQVLNFRVSEVHYAGLSRTATVHVRFATSVEVSTRMKTSDKDVGALAHPAGQMARLVSFSKGASGAATLRDDRVRQAIPTDRVVTVDAVLTVPVEESPTGWLYKGAPVKVGAPISFETAAYTVDGGITEVTVAEAAPAKPIAGSPVQ
jgi:hypothetical protein